jgi:3-phenylpropionate/trans-cinnamate dioxygenase ferredoxin subunit
MTAVRACSRADLPEVGVIRVVVGGWTLALVNTVEGIFAIEDRCSHADVALSEGDIDGCTIECWLHGSQFDLRTGEALSLPANQPVPVFPVTATGEGPSADIMVDISESR